MWGVQFIWEFFATLSSDEIFYPFKMQYIYLSFLTLSTRLRKKS